MGEAPSARPPPAGGELPRPESGRVSWTVIANDPVYSLSHMSSERTDLKNAVGERMHARSRELSEAWLEQLVARRSLEPIRVFPRQSLLDHIPDLLGTIARSIADGTSIDRDPKAVAKLRDLAELRRLQGFAVSEIVDEFELLGGIFFDALIHEMDGPAEGEERSLAIEVARSAAEAFLVLSRVTSDHFLRAELDDRIGRADLLSEYARTLRHELKNHADTAMLWLQLAKDEMASGDVAASTERVEKAERTIRRIAEIGIHTYAVTVSQGRPFAQEARRQGLGDVLDELLEDLRLYAAEFDVQLRPPTSIPGFAVDAGRLQLILVNLISNAVKFADLERSGSWVALRIESGGGRLWRLVVSDNGTGIPESARERVFDSYFRADPDSEIEGDGLGLALARTAAEQMGGHLRLERSDREGTTFVLEILEPLEQLERTPQRSDGGSERA